MVAEKAVEGAYASETAFAYDLFYGIDVFAAQQQPAGISKPDVGQIGCEGYSSMVGYCLIHIAFVGSEPVGEGSA